MIANKKRKQMTSIITGIRISLKNKHAEKELRKGHPEKTLKIVMEVLELDDANALAHFICGNAYDQKREYRQAKEEYSKAIDLSPEKMVAGYYNRSLMNLKLDLLPEAIFDLDHLAAMEPTKSEKEIILGQRSMLKSMQKDFIGSLEDINAVINLGYKHSGYQIRAKVYEEMEKYPEAIEDLTRLIKMNSHDAVALCRRGILLEKIGEYQKAEADLAKGLKYRIGCSKELLAKADIVKQRLDAQE
jgi:tetratricopeptide (TPR) repeat protein